MIVAVSVVIVSFLLPTFIAQTKADSPPADWTVMIYGGVDSSAEAHILPHLSQLRSASKAGQRGHVVLLYDRAPGYTDDAKLFGENFEDTRLFTLRDGTWHRVAGGPAFPEITLDSTYEANTGDADTLKKFIRFAKGDYPAKRYALIVFGHGHCRSVCPDETNKDAHGKPDEIHTAEITDVLTEAESVDLIWFDVCSYGGIENAYQFRPGTGGFFAHAMLATPPSSSPAPMRRVLTRAGVLGKQSDADSVARDGLEFGTRAITVIEENLKAEAPYNPRVGHECWGLYDLSIADAVKRAVDELSVAIAQENARVVVQEIRGAKETLRTMAYFSPNERAWASEPHFDLYDLAQRIHDHPGLSDTVRGSAGKLATTVDQMVVASVGMNDYDGFTPGKNGIFILFPDGDATHGGRRHWEAFTWYHPRDRSTEKAAFGKFSWCRDGATEGNGKIENWFELLDFWYDDTTQSPAGTNGYAR
jgi:clostripain